MRDSSIFLPRRSRIGNPSDNLQSARSLEYAHSLVGLEAARFKIMTAERKAKSRGLEKLYGTVRYKSATEEEKNKQEAGFIDANHEIYLRRFEAAKTEYTNILSSHEEDEENLTDREEQEDELEVVGKAANELILRQ
jgi:hypothetical protein